MQRTFILGDEWLYYKLYCGKRTADIILVEVIKPLVEKLLTKEIIDQWFFIRYSDPKSHLRIRFHCNEINNLVIVINELKKAIKEYVENDLIWKVEVGAYQRELERYGVNTVIVSEKIFFIQSETCISLLNSVEDDDSLFLFTLKSIDTLLGIFEFSLENKLLFVKKNLKAFKNEFNSNKELNKQLNKKYAVLREQIKTFMSVEKTNEYKPLRNFLKNENNKLEELYQNLDKHKKQNILSNDVLSSYVHMMINRVFRDKQRLHELVCYDCLYRFYNFKIAITDG